MHIAAAVPSDPSATFTAAIDKERRQAITNNHLLGDGDAEHEAEFAAMQQWRTLAKRTADDVLQVMQG